MYKDMITKEIMQECIRSGHDTDRDGGSALIHRLKQSTVC